MAKIKLKKKNYLGEGYVHVFRKDLTDEEIHSYNNEKREIVYVPCTKEEYERMGKKGGAQYNPTLEGHTWISSGGGTIKVDNPNEQLGDNEYVEIGEDVHVVLGGYGDAEKWKKLSKSEIVNDEVDDKKWKEK